MIISRYPHRLHYDAGVLPAVQKDANDYLVQPARVASPVVLECRLETSDAGSGTKTTKSEDGQQRNETYKIFMPLSVPAIPIGTMVEIFKGETRIAKESVKRTYPAFFDYQVWI